VNTERRIIVPPRGLYAVAIGLVAAWALRMAERADRVISMTAGLPLVLKDRPHFRREA